MNTRNVSGDQARVSAGNPARSRRQPVTAIRLALSALCVGSLLGLNQPALAAAKLDSTVTTGSEPGKIMLNVSNTGDSPAWLLRWGTPFENTATANMLEVSRAGKGWPEDEQLSYTGLLVKRDTPKASDYLRVDPGQTLSAGLDVASHYAIDEANTYTISYTAPLQYRNTDPALATRASANRSGSAAATVELRPTGGAMQLELYPVAESAKASASSQTRHRAPAYANCSVERIPAMEEALGVAERISGQALNDLNSLTTDQRARSPRYTLWFGAYTDNRFDTVRDSYSAIDEVLQNRTVTLNCDCQPRLQDAFAYVYADKPYHIHLCNAFWNATADGQDSRGGTLVHELSHFDVVAGTRDHEYSHPGTQELAQRSPDLAIKNADSIEYFAENAPFVSLLPAGESAAENTGGAGDADINFIELALNTPVAAALAQGQSHYYRLQGAASVELAHNEGDVDLYLFADAQLTSPVCSANTGQQAERCELAGPTDVYVQVTAAAAANYTLIAQGPATDQTDRDPITPLILNQIVQGRVEARRYQRYSIEGPASVYLNTLNGDADLYLFSTPEPNDNALLCSSYQRGTTNDQCHLPANRGTVYVFVYGFESGDYQLVAQPIQASARNDDQSGGEKGYVLGGGGAMGLGWLAVLALFSVTGRVLRRIRNAH